MASDGTGSGAERRTSERIPARIEVRFHTSEQVARAIKAYSLNFSVGGLCIKTQKTYALGHELTLSLDVSGVQFKLKGVVAWVRSGTIGVRFVEVGPEDRARLTAMIAELKA